MSPEGPEIKSFTPSPASLPQELKKSVESLKPEPLSDERIGDMLAGFGNSESKATTFLVLALKKIPLTRMDLYNELMDVQGEGGWKMNHNNPFIYCTNSLAPVGLVAKKVVYEEKKIYGYEVTPYGEKIGVPFAGLLLDWSLRYPDFSLYQIFGSTQSGGKTRETKSQSEDTAMLTHKNRSPATVLQILQSILKLEQPVRLIDVTTDIGKKEGTEKLHHHYLSNLSRKGIISYKTSQTTIEGKRPIVFYSLPDNKFNEQQPPNYKKARTLTHNVYEIYKEHVGTPLSAQDVMKLLIEKNKNYSKLKQRSLRSLISKILRFLSKNGYLINTTDYSSSFKTDISLNEKQREALTDLVNIIFTFQKQDPAIIAFGQKKAREILHDPKSVSQLMIKAKESSSHTQSRPMEETTLHIIKILKHKPEGMTTNEIQKILQEQFGIKLSYKGIQTILGRFQGQLSIKKRGSVNVYAINNTSESP